MASADEMHSVTPDFVLVLGYHRLEACRALGWEMVPALVMSFEELDRRLAEIDENLVRAELTELEKVEALAEQKAIYEAKHPETRSVTVRGGPGRGRKTAASAATVLPFAHAAAARTSTAPRTVRQHVQIARSLPQPIRDALRATPAADCQTDLLKLARMPPQEQKEVARKLEKGEARTIKEAKRLAEGFLYEC